MGWDGSKRGWDRCCVFCVYVLVYRFLIGYCRGYRAGVFVL